MANGNCKLCGKFGTLCDSHSIPDSAFKNLYRKSSGKAIYLTSDDTTPIHYSSDSWAEYMLCENCEKDLNKKYDHYGLQALKGKASPVEISLYGVTFKNIDRNRLRMFFLSVLWRISVAKHLAYGNIDLPDVLENELKTSILSNKSASKVKFHVGLYRMTDSSGVKGFSREELRNLVCAPFGRQYSNLISVCYILYGFFVEIFIGKMPKKFASKPGVLKGVCNIFLAPHVEILEIPELVRVLGQSLEKQENGNSNIA